MLLVLLAIARLMLRTGEASDNQASRALQSGNWEVRSGAVIKMSADSAYVNNPVVQTRLINLLKRESLDPNWTGKEEGSAYEKYYEALGNLVKGIADKTQKSDAWRAVVESNFDERSKFALQIEESAGSMPYLIEASKSVHQIVQGRSAYMLADELSKCKGADAKEKCGEVLKHSATILAILREAASQSQRQAQQLGAVRGLGLCGEAKDITFLRQLGSSNPDRAFNVFISRACQQIQAREQNGGVKP